MTENDFLVLWVKDPPLGGRIWRAPISTTEKLRCKPRCPLAQRSVPKYEAPILVLPKWEIGGCHACLADCRKNPGISSLLPNRQSRRDLKSYLSQLQAIIQTTGLLWVSPFPPLTKSIRTSSEMGWDLKSPSCSLVTMEKFSSRQKTSSTVVQVGTPDFKPFLIFSFWADMGIQVSHYPFVEEWHKVKGAFKSHLYSKEAKQERFKATASHILDAGDHKPFFLVKQINAFFF